MQLSNIVPSTSPAGRWLRKRRAALSLRKQEEVFAQIVALAAEYGYPADAPEVRALWEGTAPHIREVIFRDFKEEEWRGTFDPANSGHIDMRDGVPVILKYPMGITYFERNFGAARADVVRAHLPEAWEQDCDRIVIRSHETTFYRGEVPLVIFYASGRKMHAGSWARTWNALDAIKTHIGIDIDPNDVAIPDCSNYPDFVIEKIGDEWTWPSRQHA